MYPQKTLASLCRWLGGGVDITIDSGEEHNYAIKLAFKAINNEAEYKVLLVGLSVVEK